MKIETKYNINDEVWFFNGVNLSAYKCKVLSVEISVESKEVFINRPDGKRGLTRTGDYEQKGIIVKYYLQNGCSVQQIVKNESDLFPTKEALKETIIGTANKL